MLREQGNDIHDKLVTAFRDDLGNEVCQIDARDLGNEKITQLRKLIDCLNDLVGGKMDSFAVAD